MWPNVNDYAKTLITETIEPNVRASLEAYKLNGFRFQRIILGSIVSIFAVSYIDKTRIKCFIVTEGKLWYGKHCMLLFYNICHCFYNICLTVIILELLEGLQKFLIYLFQPLRIGGVKVYDHNVSRSEIIMDMDVL